MQCSRCYRWKIYTQRYGPLVSIRFFSPRPPKFASQKAERSLDDVFGRLTVIPTRIKVFPRSASITILSFLGVSNTSVLNSECLDFLFSLNANYRNFKAS